MNKDSEEIINAQKRAEQLALNTKKVHIHVKQRKGKKFVTTASGLDQALNFERITRHLQKVLGCNGSVFTDDEGQKYILLQGNWAESLSEFLLKENMARKDQMEIHSA